MPTQSSRPSRTEANYPPTYRHAEVTTILRAVQARYSIMVCGRGGSGKSHLLRFLAFHPALPQTLNHSDLIRVYLDCNAAIADDAAGVFRALLLESSPDNNVPDRAPDMLLALRSTLAARMTDTTRYLIVLDRFERIPPTVQPAVLDGLRHLRDYLDRRVSYVLGSRTPPPIAELSEEFDDLLAAPPVVWIGPLSREDAAWNIRAILAEQAITPEESVINALYACSGGHPRLLRTIALAWAEEPLSDPATRCTKFLGHRQVARVCEALVREFDGESQALLHRAALGERIDLPRSHSLWRYGMLHENEHAVAAITGLVIEEYVRSLAFAPALDLTALEQRLWEIVQGQPGVLLRRDDLITTLYGDNPDGINDEALTALVARLRRKLQQAHLGTLEAVRGLGYRFTPITDTGGWQ